MPLFAYGFRPFFLLTAALAVAQMPLWLLSLAQRAPASLTPGGVSWHAHEMIFGFAAAAIAGFLLTAARNWTQRDTASGGALALLTGIWLAGRVAVASASVLPTVVVAAADLAFLPMLGLFVARPIVQARQWRQLGILVALVALSGANLAYHLAPIARRTAWLFAVDFVLVLVVIIGGRVIPMFTKNAIPQANVRTTTWLERACLASVIGVALCELAGLSLPLALSCLAAGGLNAARLLRWDGRRTLRLPILWVLHLGYAFLCLGFAARGAALLSGGVGETAALHVLTTGAIGLMILGMMSRVALGHTGRRIIASPPAVLSFGLLALAVPVRALLPLLVPAETGWWYTLAGALWTAAFALFLLRYSGWLVGPRADGRPG